MLRREHVSAVVFLVAILLALTFSIRETPEPRPVALSSPAPTQAAATPAPPPRAAVWIQGEIPGVVPADLEDQLMQLRGLSFRHAVPAAMQSKTELKKYLANDPDEAPVAEQYACLRVFGFVPPGFDLAKFKLDLLTSQVGGYYDPATKKFNVVDQGLSPSWMSNLMIGGLMGVNPQAVVTIHEMDHALDDQYFDIHRMAVAARKAQSDDLELATTALFEGDASWLMFDYAMRGMVGGVHLRDMPEDQIASLVDQGTATTDNALADLDGKPVPLFFRRTLVFPYLNGMRFIHHLLLQADDWSVVNRAWLMPPVSTQQILHPELYPQVVPRRVAWKEPLRPLAGWQPVCENTLGEFLLTVFLEQHLQDPSWQLAAHWQGDRYRVYQKGSDLAMVWDVVLDSPESAGTLSDRIKVAHRRTADPLKGVFKVTLSGSRVHVVYGAPPALAKQLGPATVSPGQPLQVHPPLPVLPVRPAPDFADDGGHWFSGSQDLGLRVPPNWTSDTDVSGAVVLRVSDPDQNAGATVVLSVPTTNFSHEQAAMAWLTDAHKLHVWTEMLNGTPLQEVEYDGTSPATQEAMHLRYVTTLYRGHTFILTMWWPTNDGPAGDAIADSIVHSLEFGPDN